MLRNSGFFLWRTHPAFLAFCPHPMTFEELTAGFQKSLRSSPFAFYDLLEAMVWALEKWDWLVMSKSCRVNEVQDCLKPIKRWLDSTQKAPQACATHQLGRCYQQSHANKTSTAWDLGTKLIIAVKVIWFVYIISYTDNMYNTRIISCIIAISLGIQFIFGWDYPLSSS